MPPPPIDEQDLEALNNTSLEFFKAEPDTVGPFASSHLSWKVNAPDRVTVLLEGSTVPKQGGQYVSPDGTHGYRLTAKAGTLSKLLGTATVHVNLSQCIELDTGVLHLFLEPKIKEKIDADTSGIYFRNIVTLENGSVTSVVRATPKVWITPGRLHILLQLGQEVNNFPNPDVDISVSFGLGLVDDSITVLRTRIIATNAQIDVSITFPWYAWLVPGAAIALPIAIDMAEDKARKRAHEMITEIVGPSIRPTHDGLAHDLNSFWPPPSQIPRARKQGVRLYMDQDGHGVFAVRFCPSNVVIG
jgi:hypothetical protein